MLDQVIRIYIIIDDILKILDHQGHCRCQMSDSEVITTLLVSTLFFGGNQAKARDYHLSEGPIPHMLSASRFNRRLHRNWDLILALFYLLDDLLKHNNDSSRYLVDSFPVAVCHNIRISRSKILKGKYFRGKCVSKRTYFYGFKVFLITTEAGLPVEVAFVPGSWAEIRGLEALAVDLPPGREL
ncbi:MAG: transposase [Bacteroidota bacterium]